MNISVSYYTEIGGRDTNEDAVSLMENGDAVLGIVADGLADMMREKWHRRWRSM